jgi:hypothetical protein
MKGGIHDDAYRRRARTRNRRGHRAGPCASTDQSQGNDRRPVSLRDALTIVARIGDCPPNELEKQSGLGVRRIPWSELGRRGAELAALVDEVVAEVEAAAARVDQVRADLRLLPSPPPIAKQAVAVELPSLAGDAGKEQAMPAVPEQPLRQRITDAGLDRLREACPGWDLHWLLLRYLEFMSDKPAPNNPDASLVAWGRRFTKGKQP